MAGLRGEPRHQVTHVRTHTCFPPPRKRFHTRSPALVTRRACFTTVPRGNPGRDRRFKTRDSFRNMADAAGDLAESQGGILSDMTSGTIEQWTHPDMFTFFEDTWHVSREFFLNRDPPLKNCNGAFRCGCAASMFANQVPPVTSLSPALLGCTHQHSTWFYQTPNATRGLEMWAECAKHRECICPIGSTRGNHRQDQAALTLILTMHNVQCGLSWVHPHGLKARGHHGEVLIQKFLEPGCLPNATIEEVQEEADEAAAATKIRGRRRAREAHQQIRGGGERA